MGVLDAPLGVQHHSGVALCAVTQLGESRGQGRELQSPSRPFIDAVGKKPGQGLEDPLEWLCLIL